MRILESSIDRQLGVVDEMGSSMGRRDDDFVLDSLLSNIINNSVLLNWSPTLYIAFMNVVQKPI